MTYGATALAAGGVQFRAWGPNLRSLAVKLERGEPGLRQMRQCGEDFEVLVPEARAGDLYRLVLNGEKERPDPLSRSQPQGVHGPSEIVDPHGFEWTDQGWTGLALGEYVLYELHIGTFTPEGTFQAAIGRLPYLKELGITAVELMPVAEFPGARNWGYDGVSLYAPHSAYGGPAGLKQLVDACHQQGLGVVLDVVYNHLGPEGNYLGEFGPYFTDRYRTPWGQAINFDGPGSDGVRRFFIENALFWLTEYHMDALRLDAIHGIFDFSALHILAELGERFHEEAKQLGRQAFVIAESDLNDVRVIRPWSAGGYGLDAQWHDEFHHAVASYMTGADRGYLAGFGRLADIQKALTDGFVYDGRFSAYRGRRFGSSSKEEPGQRFVAFLQNHDQVANTFQGRRLSELVSMEEYKLAVALLLCSPYLPLLFMGEEFADRAPFLYFTSHTDPDLEQAVTQGRRREFADFAAGNGFHDPQSPETFQKSKLTWGLAAQPEHAAVLRLYRDLIALRKRRPCLGNGRKDLVRVDINERQRWLRMERGDPSGVHGLLLCNFSSAANVLAAGPEEHAWQLALWTGSETYGGGSAQPEQGGGRPVEISLPAHSAALYVSVV